jgi:hypothetical protein
MSYGRRSSRRAPRICGYPGTGVGHRRQIRRKRLHDDCRRLWVVGAGRTTPEAGVTQNLVEQRPTGIRLLRDRTACGLDLLEIRRCAALRITIPSEAVLWLAGAEGDLAEIAVARVTEVTIVHIRVVEKGIAFGVVYAPESGILDPACPCAGLTVYGLATVRVWHKQSSPRPVVDEPVVHHGHVARS